MTSDYILTTFSPAMFGEGASVLIRVLAFEEASSLVTTETRVVTTRPSHERLAKNQFPSALGETARYAQLKPGVNAIHLHYRGPEVPDSGELPIGSMVTFYLVETEAYHSAEPAPNRTERLTATSA